MEPTKPKLNWSPSVQNPIVEFSAQTSCNYLELLVNPRSSSVVMLEGTLDDASLLEWFQRVLFTNNNDSQTISLLFIRIIQAALQQPTSSLPSSLVDYDYCKLTTGLRLATELKRIKSG